jgi:DNA repair photolyase
VIISASRRTDIPAFYADWFMNRVRAGFCMVANPWNPRQVGRVSLKPADVDAMVFWSKNPAPLVSRLAELDKMKLRYYFLFTLNDCPDCLEPHLPSLEERIRTFRDLSTMIGKEKVVWRYDPVILSNILDCDYHRRAFSAIARSVCGHTGRVIVSVLDFYARTERRLSDIEDRTGDRFVRDPFALPGFGDLARDLAWIAAENGMQIQSCAEDDRLAALGIRPGKCIDDELIRSALAVSVSSAKDPGQRGKCLCVASRDIGANDSCAHGCVYCYAASSAERAVARCNAHDPNSPMLSSGTSNIERSTPNEERLKSNALFDVQC